MMSVPTLPKETAYLYARFNMIEKISNNDFSDIGKMIFVHYHTLFFIASLETDKAMLQGINTLNHNTLIPFDKALPVIKTTIVLTTILISSSF